MNKRQKKKLLKRIDLLFLNWSNAVDAAKNLLLDALIQHLSHNKPRNNTN